MRKASVLLSKSRNVGWARVGWGGLSFVPLPFERETWEGSGKPTGAPDGEYGHESNHSLPKGDGLDAWCIQTRGSRVHEKLQPPRKANGGHCQRCCAALGVPGMCAGEPVPPLKVCRVQRVPQTFACSSIYKEGALRPRGFVFHLASRMYPC